MLLTKHKTPNGSRWAVDGRFLPSSLHLSTLLEIPSSAMLKILTTLSNAESAVGEQEAPIDPFHEVWAAGVTYLRSRDARKAESTVADMYQRVYEAKRPEIFSKSTGWRVSGNGVPIHIRQDSHWNVPEPELVLVINRHNEIVGYCAGNDVSSRDIEGENPLYLPQAKIYNGSCALGHGIWLCTPDEIKDIPIRLKIQRANEMVFNGEANTSSMKRTFPELVEFLTRELDFPHGVFLMTGTCLVPGNEFTLQPDDLVLIQVGKLMITNQVSNLNTL
ncbi:MAG TPA: fumarylacetoacetate hydrolase family protein [Anaerolineales bacterium]|nr:fumarylacetoacetate hydrolase family protein [Anaerolineales bacterium]